MAIQDSTLTQSLLLDFFEYKDGDLYWKKDMNHITKAGNVAGSSTAKDYKNVIFNGRAHKVHRLIFLYHHGYLPEVVDHIDGNPINNKIENLRAADSLKNSYNKKIPLHNTSGVKGVHWHTQDKKWRVQFNVNGKSKYFGSYNDIDYAKFVAEAMRYKYHGEFANNG